MNNNPAIINSNGIEASDEPSAATKQPPPPPDGGAGVGGAGGLLTIMDSVVTTIDSLPLPIVISKVEVPEVLLAVTEAV
tara:strand:- start:153 stop:389 length:237 start_codon:yes stop_codon:yes gene_type:complete